MSKVEAKIVRVEILPHENADKLEVARIGGAGGFECVVGLGQFTTGDLALYIPVDSVVPKNIQEHLAKNKVNIKSGRIRCAKIRGKFSEGLCLTPSDWLEEKDIKEGNDVTKTLGIKKYEPPPPSWRTLLGTKHGINLNYENDRFIEYTCVEKFKKYPHVLKDGEQVVATIKWHGTNWRAGLVKKPPRKKTVWEKLKGLFIKESLFEFLVGSHSKIRQPTKKSLESGEYRQDTYWRVVDKYNIQHVVEEIQNHESLFVKDGDLPEVVIYGEIIGRGIQKGYDYNVTPGEVELRIFDIRVGNKFFKWDYVKHFCECFDLPTVQEVYRGPWSLDVLEHARVVDEIGDKKFNREGIVIRPLIERWHPDCGRVIFKYLNEAYELDKSNSEHH